MIVDSRLVGLNVLRPPTIENVIVATIRPVDATGESYTLTIPDKVRAGDLMLASFAYIRSDADEDGNLTGYVDTPTGWELYPETGAWTAEKLPEHYIIESIHLDVFNKIATESDAGSDVVFNYVTGEATTIDEVIFFFVATNGTYVSDWQDNNTVYYDIEGYGTFEETFYFPSVDVAKKHSLLCFFAVMKGAHAFDLYGTSELGQLSGSSISFCSSAVMQSAIGASEVIYPYTETIDYFGTITLSVEMI